MSLMLGSFFKFRFLTSSIKVSKRFYVFYPLLIAGLYVLFPFPFINAGYFLILDLLIMVLIIAAARFMYEKLSIFSCLDTKFLYINMNYELLYIVVLIIAQILLLRVNIL